ncbi:unnamed protein product [Trypanosoma congolense IL3000]|uniref:WGS project CAEQ00000000 data, annotated contig 1938 n=1 Tax=Trypanosoma congolense (strain IL3000) TaxID=1068625 RepID=F9WA55_TRYCI|nr:unnamed protein product [Trypanosoma congolense IL3000]
MNSDGSEMAVLQDPSSYTRSIRKDSGARWVQGLTPIEPEDGKKLDGPNAGRRRAVYLVNHWLRAPLVFGICHLVIAASIVSGLYRPCVASDSGRRPELLDFPMDESELEKYTAGQAETLMQYAAKVRHVWLVSVPLTLFSLSLSWKIGVSAHNFPSLCGVGVSILSAVATVGQFLVLWTACGVREGGGSVDCNIPFVFYWCHAVMRIGGPLLSVFLCAPVLDNVQNKRLFWKVTLSIPFLCFLAGATYLICNINGKLGASGYRFDVLYWCCCATLLTWTPLLVSCYRQPRFRATYEPKEHRD